MAIPTNTLATLMRHALALANQTGLDQIPMDGDPAPALDALEKACGGAQESSDTTLTPEQHAVIGMLHELIAHADDSGFIHEIKRGLDPAGRDRLEEGLTALQSLAVEEGAA